MHAMDWVRLPVLDTHPAALPTTHSLRLFWMGVPVTRRRALVGQPARAIMVLLPSLLFSRWPSSQTSASMRG